MPHENNKQVAGSHYRKKGAKKDKLKTYIAQRTHLVVFDDTGPSGMLSPRSIVIQAEKGENFRGTMNISIEQRFKQVPTRERLKTLIHRRTHGSVLDDNGPAGMLSTGSIVLGGGGAGHSNSEQSKNAYCVFLSCFLLIPRPV